MDEYALQHRIDGLENKVKLCEMAIKILIENTRTDMNAPNTSHSLLLLSRLFDPVYNDDIRKIAKNWKRINSENKSILCMV